MNIYARLLKIGLTAILLFSLAGCTFIFQKGRTSDIQKIEDLSQQVDELAQAKDLLEGRLSQEIKDKQVTLKMMEKGLVITFLTDVLFDSGKAVLKPEVYPTLDKVAKVLQEEVAKLNVGIEGHTDNVPIKHSGWKSNWELSAARSLSVLHYLVDQKEIAPQRLSSIGYGEYHPVASNMTAEGRKENRRVEVIIMPQLLTKTKGQKAAKSRELKEPAENLK